MTTTYDVWQYLRKRAEEQGLEYDSRSGLLSNKRTSQLINAVREYLLGMGMDHSLESAQEILEMRVPNLVSSWTGVDTEAKRAVDKYLKVHPTGPCRPNNDEKPPENGGGSDDGNGGDGNDDDSWEQPRGGSNGSSENGNGSGSGAGDGANGDENENETGNGSGGSGAGDSADGDENEDESDDNNGGNGSGQPPQPEPAPDVPQPDDPEYIKPDVWDQVMRVIMWNMEHPGKQKNIMLTGPRGVGKTEMVIQMSKALAQVRSEDVV